MEMNENNYGLVKMQEVLFYQSSNNSSLVYAKSYFQIRFYPSNWSGFYFTILEKENTIFLLRKVMSFAYNHNHMFILISTAKIYLLQRWFSR